MPLEQSIINLPNFQLLNVSGTNPVLLEVKYTGINKCAHCDSTRLRTKDSFERKIRHESIGLRICFLLIQAKKFYCKVCNKYFNQRFPGILPYKQSTERFRSEVYEKHSQGIPQSTLSSSIRIGQATVERWYQDFIGLKIAEMSNRVCPRVLGIDEKFFTRKRGYMTSIVNLEKNKVFDLFLGRSEKALESQLKRLKGRHRVQVVVMDLSSTFRSIVQKYFPNAMIVADRFHVIRLVNQAFLKTWQQLDPGGRKNRGLLSLMRRHECNLEEKQKSNLRDYLSKNPILEQVYDFKQSLCKLLNQKHQKAFKCRKLIPEYLKAIEQLKLAPIEALKTLGETLESWAQEIVRMWRFTKTNSITEGFHNKMECIIRRAYGFRNFNNFRLRVLVLCG